MNGIMAHSSAIITMKRANQTRKDIKPDIESWERHERLIEATGLRKTISPLSTKTGMEPKLRNRKITLEGFEKIHYFSLKSKPILHFLLIDFLKNFHNSYVMFSFLTMAKRAKSWFGMQKRIIWSRVADKRETTSKRENLR